MGDYTRKSTAQEKHGLFALHSVRRGVDCLQPNTLLIHIWMPEKHTERADALAYTSVTVFFFLFLLIKGESSQMIDMWSLDLRSGNKLLPLKKEEMSVRGVQLTSNQKTFRVWAGHSLMTWTNPWQIKSNHMGRSTEKWIEFREAPELIWGGGTLHLKTWQRFHISVHLKSILVVRSHYFSVNK